MIRWLIRTVRTFLRRNQANAVEAYSAQAALFVVISFFPFALLLLAILPYLPISKIQMGSLLTEIVPNAIADYVQEIFNQLYATSSLSLISVTAVITLWSSSKGAMALMRGLDRIYGIQRRRGYFLLRLAASLYQLLLFFLLSCVLAFLGFGKLVFQWLIHWFPALTDNMFLKRSVQFLASFLVLFILFFFMYTVISRRKKHFLREVPGAVVAAGGWVGFSAVYSVYLDNINGISMYYGSLSLIMFSLIWLYFCMYIFFVGAEINVWLGENRQLLVEAKKYKHKKKEESL